MSVTAESQRAIRLVAGFISLLAVATLLGENLGGWPIWGLSTWGAFPIWLSATLTAVVVSVAIPLFRVSKSNGLRRVKEPFESESAWWVILIAVLVVLWVIGSKNYLLGDGLSILDRTINGVDFAPFSRPNVWLHEFLFKVLPGESAKNSDLAYRITSVLSGSIVLVSVAILIKGLWSRLLALTILFSFGATQLFAGYVERYPLAFAAMTLFLVLAYQDWEQRRTRIVTAVVLLFALAMHLAAIVLLPVLIAIVIHRNPTPQALKMAKISAITATLGGLVFYFAINQTSSIFVPFIATATNPYSLMSTTRWLDLLNVALLSYPLIFVLPFLPSFWKSADRRFYLAAILPALGFVIIVDPKLGAIRDWDLMSLVAIPTLVITILIVTRLVRERSGSIQFATVMFAAFALLHTGSWLYLNSDGSAAYESVKLLVRDDPHYSSAYNNGSGNLQWAAVTQEFYGDGPEGILAQERRLAGAPEDAINRHNLAFNYVRIDNWQRANELLTGHWQEYPLSREVTIEISNVFAHEQNLGELERLYERFVEADSSEIPLFFQIADAKEQRGALDSALSFYDRGLRLSADTTIAIARKAAELRIRTSRIEQAQSILTAILPKATIEQQPAISAAIKALTKNQAEAALQALAELAKLLRAQTVAIHENHPETRMAETDASAISIGYNLVTSR